MISAKNIIAALGGCWHGHYGVARCPAHADKNPSLSVSDGDNGVVLVKCFAGCDALDVIGALRHRGLWPDLLGDLPRRPCTQRVKRRREERAHPNLAAASAMWKSALPANGTPVGRYLKSRGIEILPPTLRYVPDALHRPTGLRLPCMLAGVTIWPSREVHAVHRTFLTADGRAKAPVSSDKMMLGPCAGGAVRLAKAADVLLVGEGVETALSAMQATGIPAWAALSTSGMRSVVLPEESITIVILADGDEGGRAAGEALGERLMREGRNVNIARPPEGMDFNDLLLLPDNVVIFPQRGRAA